MIYSCSIEFIDIFRTAFDGDVIIILSCSVSVMVLLIAHGMCYKTCSKMLLI